MLADFDLLRFVLWGGRDGESGSQDEGQRHGAILLCDSGETPAILWVATSLPQGVSFLRGYGVHSDTSAGRLERLSCDRETDPEKQRWTYIYGVHARTKGGSKVDLVTELDRAQALFIKQELERWLKINDHGLGREIPC